ncbi:hypothetical protein [Paucibacter sp. DJ2R-2]|uniref:hypothetical protein n=1 Tax=Paucibacter sp. DJ2R-2 TaxID=2893558 RepID=UPI0021E4E2AB|nr:hypothetical protein [Paucibacter sp. DJ2R-2]MCV2439268.1 hypothetical protein [Paucibacter sp. DJ2R-2]
MNTKRIKQLLAAASIAAIAALPTASNAATYLNPYNGLWYGNVCQGAYGWVWIGYQPIGNNCYDPRIGWGVVNG